MGKGAVALAAGLVALQVLPGLLRPPQAPPLAADVGLPRVAGAERELVIREAEPKPRPQPKPKPLRAHGLSAATAVIGTKPRRRVPKRRPVESLSHTERKSPAPSQPVPTPAPEPPPYAPPPEPEPVPAPAPDPPPPPSDGSVEFAPH